MSETTSPLSSYEPPRIERVLTPKDLEHEILYAGPTDLSADSVPV